MKNRKSTTLVLRKRASILSILVASAFALSACGGGGGGSDGVITPTANIVTSANQAATGTLIGQTVTVNVPFNTDAGTATDLKINLSALPAGWAVVPDFSTCPSVASSGAGCQLSLTYSPTEAKEQDSFTLTYSYTDAAGTPKTGNVTITYSAVDPASITAFSYITQRGLTANTGSILKCNVSADGVLNDCAESGAGTSLPGPISLAFSGANAFILNETASTPAVYSVYKCTAEASGVLSNCAITPTQEIENVSEIAATPVSGYALKANQILKCSIDFSGLCSSTGGVDSIGPGVNAEDMLFSGDRVYVVNSGSTVGAVVTPASVMSCAVDATGAVSGCASATTDATFNTALRIDEASVDTPVGIAIKDSNAYILTRYSNSVIQCTLNTTLNTITGCTSTSIPSLASGTATPNRIAIEGNNAFITSESTTVGDNSVTKCSITDGTGVLGACASAITGASPFTSEISDIKFTPIAPAS